MVHLFNITINDDSISCDYDPEKCGKIGKVVVDKTTQDIKSVLYSEYEYGRKMYVAHVRSKLCELLKYGEKAPREAVVVWF